jgi:hypothetical protein
MAYEDEGFEDESISALLESDDGSTWDPATIGEATLGPRYRRNVSRGPTPVPRVRRREVAGVGGVSVRTPAGQAQMKFEKPVATKESVDAAVRELKTEIAAVAASVKKVDETVDKNTAILDKKVLALEAIVKKGQQGSQMGFLLPLLLSKPPQINTLKVKLPNQSTETTVTVTDTKYREGDNLGLLIAMMAMSGGLGGGGGNDSMNMLLPLLVLSGGLGGSSSSK